MRKILVCLLILCPILIWAQTEQDKAKARSLGLNEFQVLELQKYANGRGLNQSTSNQKTKPVTKTISRQAETEGVEIDTFKVKDVNNDALGKDKDTVSQKSSATNLFGYDIFTKSSLTNFDVKSSFFAGDDYTLGIGDQISISIWGASNYSNSYVIGTSGAIDVERVGRIYLNGIDLGKARKIVKNKLATVFNLNSSSVEINLNYSRDLFIQIVGGVNVQGTFKIKGYHSVFNALYLSKGINNLGTLRDIKVKRDGKVVHSLDVYRYLMDSTYNSKFSLKNNDFIIVGNPGKIVSIEGEVRKSNSFELKDKEGLKALINYSGGLKSSAYKKRIKVVRVTENHEEIIDVNWQDLYSDNKDFELKDGDKVFVRKVPNYINNLVKIEGAVNIPGEYELEDSMTVLDLIRKAEGLRDDAYTERFYLVRTMSNFEKQYESLNGNEILKDSSNRYNYALRMYDKITIFSRKDFIENDSVMISGAVRKAGKYVFGKGMNVKDLLYLAGGLKREAAISRIEISRIIDFNKDLNVYRPSRTVVKSIEVDYNMTVSDKDAMFELKPMDQVFVRTDPIYEEHQNVTLIGEFKYPGTYTLLSKKDRLYNVIQRAGGVTEWAFLEGTKLYRKERDMGYLFIELDELLKNPKSEFNYVLKSGDTIFLPKVNDLVSISGLIEYPDIDSIGKINTPFIKGKRARYYIRKYGVGFDRSKGAVKRKTTVTMPNGIVVKTKNFLLFKKFPKVFKGSIVNVNTRVKKPKKQEKEVVPVDWNKMFENFTVKVSGVLTLYFLISQIN